MQAKFKIGDIVEFGNVKMKVLRYVRRASKYFVVFENARGAKEEISCEVLEKF